MGAFFSAPSASPRETFLSGMRLAWKKRMEIREIPKESWASFLDSFSRQHELWRVSMEIVDPESEAHAVIAAPALVRIRSADNKISIMLRNPENRETTIRAIEAPAHLWLEETAEGAHKALHIESVEGTRTLVSFHSAVLPETMDGILDDQVSENRPKDMRKGP